MKEWEIIDFEVLTSSGIRLKAVKNDYVWREGRAVQYAFAVHEEDISEFTWDKEQDLRKEFSSYISSHFGDDLSEFQENSGLPAYNHEYYMPYSQYQSEEYQTIKEARISL